MPLIYIKLFKKYFKKANDTDNKESSSTMNVYIFWNTINLYIFSVNKIQIFKYMSGDLNKTLNKTLLYIKLPKFYI